MTAGRRFWPSIGWERSRTSPVTRPRPRTSSRRCSRPAEPCSRRKIPRSSRRSCSAGERRGTGATATGPGPATTKRPGSSRPSRAAIRCWRESCCSARPTGARGRDEAGSIALYEGALASRKATLSEPSFAIADNETWLAWTLARLGRRAEAERYARDASRQLDALGYADHSLRGTLDILRADTLTLSGHAAEAETLYGAAAERFRKIRQRQGGGYIRRSFPLDGYDSLALAALRRGDGEQAWRLIERSRAATHVDFASLGLWKRQDPAGFEAWTADRRALDRVRKRLTPLHGGPRWTASTAQGFLEMLRLRARISREEDRYLDAFRPAIPSLERVQETLGPQQALVGWLEVRVGGTPSESFMAERSDGYAYVVRPSGPVRWVPLWKTRSSTEEARLVGAWGHAFGRLTRAASWPTRVGADSELDAQLRAWGRVHVDPILPLLEGVDHLVLERLSDPIELAVLPDGRLLGDAFDVSYVPSALALVLLADVPTDEGASRARSALTVAGPTDTLADARVDQLVGSADAPSDHRGGRTAYRRSETPLNRLPRLRYAGLEARSVASLFDDARVLGGDDAAATLSQLAASDRLAGYHVLHFATHTLTDGAPERCALALSDREATDRGIVEVEDIVLGWRLDADLLTLSGCETLRAGGAGRGGEPFGFTPALFAAGARRVLSSYWPVDDRATTILMNRFYENYTGQYRDERFGAAGKAMKAPRALREARAYVRNLKDPSGRRPYEHPVYWGGFFLVGRPD